MSVKSNIGLVYSGLVWHFDPAHSITKDPALISSGITKVFHPVVEQGDLINGVTYDSGNGGSFEFDGVDDSIYFTNSSTANVTGDMTIFAWVYPVGFPSDQSSICTWANVYSGNTDFPFHFNLASTYIRFNAGIRGNYTQNASINLNEWVQIAVTYDASVGAAEYFKNGSSVGTITSYSAGDRYDATLNSAQRFSVGRYTAQFWQGKIGPIMIYDRICSSNEILQNYNALKNRFI